MKSFKGKLAFILLVQSANTSTIQVMRDALCEAELIPSRVFHYFALHINAFLLAFELLFTINTFLAFMSNPLPGPRCVARVMVGNFLYSVAFSQCQSILFPIFPATSSCALKKEILASGLKNPCWREKSSGRLSACPCNLMPRRLNEVGCEKQKASLVQYA